MGKSLEIPRLYSANDASRWLRLSLKSHSRTHQSSNQLYWLLSPFYQQTHVEVPSRFLISGSRWPFLVSLCLNPLSHLLCQTSLPNSWKVMANHLVLSTGLAQISHRLVYPQSLLSHSPETLSYWPFFHSYPGRIATCFSYCSTSSNLSNLGTPLEPTVLGFPAHHSQNYQ